LTAVVRKNRHEAIEFAQGKARVDLNGDRKLVLALVKAIEIIGEAAFQVSQETQDQLQAFHGKTL
jgi:uncharacterized protein with HEPN domain